LVAFKKVANLPIVQQKIDGVKRIYQSAGGMAGMQT
jgi:hypothetical protein